MAKSNFPNLKIKSLVNSINSNTDSKDKTAFCFIGYFKIHEKKGQLLERGIKYENLYKLIDNNNLKYENIENFIDKVNSFMESMSYYGNEYKIYVEDKFNKLGYGIVKEEFIKNSIGLDKVIASYNSVENFSIEDLIDLFEMLNISDRFFNDFFTPSSITKLIAGLVATKEFNKNVINLYDPSCGIGRLLYHSLIVLKNKYPDKIINIYGADLNTRFAVFTESIFDIINFNHVRIYTGDTLKNNFNLPVIDICLSNPPYDKKNIELQFLDHIKKLGCRAFIVLPNSFNFSEKSKKIRQELLEKDLIRGIIQLPEKMFLNTNIATSIFEIDSDAYKQLENLCIKNKLTLNKLDPNKDLQAQIKELEKPTEKELQEAKYKSMSLAEMKIEYNRLCKLLIAS